MNALYGCGHCGVTLTWPLIYYASPNLTHWCPTLGCHAFMRLMNGTEIELYWKGENRIAEAAASHTNAPPT
jgi:hypothetical protein